MPKARSTRKNNHKARIQRTGTERHPIPADQIDEITSTSYDRAPKRVKIHVHLVTVHNPEPEAFTA